LAHIHKILYIFNIYINHFIIFIYFLINNINIIEFLSIHIINKLNKINKNFFTMNFKYLLSVVAATTVVFSKTIATENKNIDYNDIDL